MACGCAGKGRAAGGTAVAGTYRVMVGGHQVYESSTKEAAETVAARFQTAEVLPPGKSAAIV